MFPSFRQARHWLARCAALLVAVCLCGMPMAQASGGGGHGGGGGGPAPMTFVVNIGHSASNPMVLQMSIVLKTANPEAAKLVDMCKPMIQHRVIIVAAGLSPDDLPKSDTINELGEHLVEAINDELGTTKKNGVTEVLFTSFLYQHM